MIAFLREENRALKAELTGRRLQLNDAQRRRLAVLGRRLGRAARREVATLVAADISRVRDTRTSSNFWRRLDYRVVFLSQANRARTTTPHVIAAGH